MPADPCPVNQLPLRIVTLIPVFNDWNAVALLLPRLDRALTGRSLAIEVLLIDDGSLTPHATALHFPPLEEIQRVAVLELKHNLGHQRAIAVGLAHVYEHLPCDAVLVMDGDGEDNPADAPRLLDETQGTTAVSWSLPRAHAARKAGCSASAIACFRYCTGC